MQQGEDAIALKEPLKTAQKAEVELELSPIASRQVFLRRFCHTLQNLLGEFGLAFVEQQDDRGDEWNLERLFNDPAVSVSWLQPSARKGSHLNQKAEGPRGDIRVKVVVRQCLCDTADILLDPANRLKSVSQSFT